MDIIFALLAGLGDTLWKALLVLCLGYALS